MNLTQYKYGLLVAFGILYASSISTPANAIESRNSTHPTISTFYLTKNNKSSSSTSPKEYIFKAPDSKTISNVEQLTKISGYKVEVYGSGQELLQQVKDIEPTAFVKGNLIQVGIFSQQNNAEDLVRKLAVAGFWARITIV